MSLNLTLQYIEDATGTVIVTENSAQWLLAAAGTDSHFSGHWLLAATEHRQPL